MNSFIEENIKGTKVEKAFNHQEINYSISPLLTSLFVNDKLLLFTLIR